EWQHIAPSQPRCRKEAPSSPPVDSHCCALANQSTQTPAAVPPQSDQPAPACAEAALVAAQFVPDPLDRAASHRQVPRHAQLRLRRPRERDRNADLGSESECAFPCAPPLSEPPRQAPSYEKPRYGGTRSR